VIQRINDNAYKIDLLGKYSVSDTFNVSDLSPYDAGEDSRLNTFEEREDDENQELKFNQPQEPTQINNSKDALQISSGPITRSRAQKLKEALIGFIQDILTAQTKSKIELKPNHVLNLIWADDGIKLRRFGLKANHLKRKAHRKCITRFNLSANGLFWA